MKGAFFRSIPQYQFHTQKRKNDFAEQFKILLDTDMKIILLDHQNTFVGTLKITSNAAKNFDILATGLSVLHNYFDSSTKLLFLNLYSAKILNLSAKLFFPRITAPVYFSFVSI